jgi:hypothetical protein
VERNELNDDLHLRLRAARPAAARVEEHALDDALLARVRQGPIAARRTVPRSLAVPVAAGAIVVATAAVVLGGGPGDVGVPSSAAAITQTLHWLTPAPDTILHVRSVETQGGRTSTRELWQSADDPHAERELIQGTTTFERSGDALYDPATDTIYDAYSSPSGGVEAPTEKPKDAGPKLAGSDQAPSPKADMAAIGAADPVVTKVRILLQEGDMSVTGRELHDGVDSWAISLRADAGRPAWTLWVSVADGKPVELRDPGRDASEQPEVIRWPIYETLADDGASAPLLTLSGAHPSAQVVHDPAQAAAAAQRLGAAQP